MKERIKSLFSLFLLMYFAGFAVAPVSAVLPSAQAAVVVKNNVAFENHSDKTAIFLYDLALWEALKKIKLSGDLGCNMCCEEKCDSAPDASDGQEETGMMNSGNCAAVLVPDMSAYRNLHSFAVQQYVHLDLSGLSPPFLA